MNWCAELANQSSTLGECTLLFQPAPCFHFCLVWWSWPSYISHSVPATQNEASTVACTKKIHIVRTGFAIRYPTKTWPWSSGTGFPIAQAATDSAVEEMTRPWHSDVSFFGGRNSSIQLGRVGKTLALGFLLLLLVDEWNHKATRGRYTVGCSKYASRKGRSPQGPPVLKPHWLCRGTEWMRN